MKNKNLVNKKSRGIHLQNKSIQELEKDKLEKIITDLENQILLDKKWNAWMVKSE
jgi:hypothetical protein